MRQVEGANDADYFVIGIIIGVLNLFDKELFYVALRRTSDSVLYQFRLNTLTNMNSLHVAEKLLKDHFGATRWGFNSPNELWVCVYKRRTDTNKGGAQ